MSIRTKEYLKDVVKELLKLPSEIEWVEFKHNNAEPQMIGEYISALSNSAAVLGRPYAYILWGVEDGTHKILGSSFDYRKVKKGNEELEAWLSRMLSPRINFKLYNFDMNGNNMTLMEIPCAEKKPTSFSGIEYIRVGSNKKKLKDYPSKESELWRSFDTTPFELKPAIENVSEEFMVSTLDYPEYYHKMNLPIPRNREKVLEDLKNEKFVKRNDAGNWDILNFGMLAIGNDLKMVDSLARKAVRVIWYKGTTRINAYREREFTEGYLKSFEEIVNYVLAIIPQEEVLDGPTRRTKYKFPEIAIRELIANSMIHQDFNQRGTNPMIEIFEDRIEFSNAGSPLVSIQRIVDTVPVSRNENLAGFMHKLGICEERGSGYDKIVASTSANNLLAPKIENQDGQFTKIILYAKIPFNLIKKEDRIWTCYMQACLNYINSSSISNADMRVVFGLNDKEKYKTSRIIKETLEKGLIKAVDPDTAPRYMRYIPFWA